MDQTLRSGIVGRLYGDHHGWLFEWLRKKLGCSHHAADLAQDTFTKLLAMPVLPLLREPRAYLLVTANRLLINQHHRRKVEDETLRTMAILAEDQSAKSPEDIAAARELLGRVLVMLATELDDRPRRAFLMVRVDGLSYGEAARQLGVSESSVKQYLAKVLVHCHMRVFGTPQGESSGV
ncbi:MAG: sigma-70 family RNA polymerase sigma factor [Nitrospirota bacterium]